MKNLIKFCLLVASILSVVTVNAEEPETLMKPITVNATKIEIKDTEATYASEVYDNEAIAQSGAKSLYDFLGQHTSAVVMPNFGNPFKAAIDIRGFGLSNGFTSVVITVDGRRLNNIDLLPQDLSTIPIGNIDRIEITKGSGSVIYGDGAVAGTIQIYTKDKTQTVLSGSGGNFGTSNASISTGLSTEYFQFSAFGNIYHQDGFSDTGPDGNRDNADREGYNVKLKLFPTEYIELYVQKDSTTENIRYPNALSKNTFDSNPGSNFKTGTIFTPAAFTNYTFETYYTSNISAGSTINIGENFEINFDFTDQEKEATSFNFIKYKTNTYEGNIKFENGPIKIIAGVQKWDAQRSCDQCFTPETFTKDNLGIYIQGSFEAFNTTFSLGARKEWVEFTFMNLSDSDEFESFDIGVNKSIGENFSIFSNYNYAFQTPNIDFFFDFMGNFNGFITPAMSQTLNLGLNHFTEKSKSSVTVYGAKINNEMFFNNITFNNTNIDDSYKYGVEVQNKYTFNKYISASINYAYIRAIIDHENTGASLGCVDFCSGNELPGVSNHNVTFGLNISPTPVSKIILTQKYLSEAFSLEDFSNTQSQKQKAFRSTDILFQYIFKKDDDSRLWQWWLAGPRQVKVFAKIENLFEQSNGIWLRNDVVYPTAFTRNWSMGAEVTF